MADGPHSSTRSRRQRDLSNIPGFNHSRRSWTSNGMRVTMETATYATPGFSFRSANDGSNIFSSFVQPARKSSTRGGGSGGLLGGGLLGGAINLLNNVANPQSRQARPRTPPERSSYVVESDEVDSDVTSSDEDLAYGSLPRARVNHSKSVLGRVKDRILEHGRPRVDEERAEAPSSRLREPRSDRRRARPPSPEAPRARTRRHSSIFNYERTPDTSPERRTTVPLPANSAHRNRTDREMATLQRAVEDERKEYLSAKHRFQQASQRSVIDAEHLQDLLNQVKVHGALLASAQRRLQVAKEQRQQRETTNRTQRQRTQRRPSPPREAYYESDEDEEHFEPWPRHGFTTFTSAPRNNATFEEPIGHAFDPFFGFRVFDRLFSEADSTFSVHGTANGFHFSPGNGGTDSSRPTFKRTSFADTSTPHGASRSRPQQHATPQQPPQQPSPQIPRTYLRATEAARLFKTYDSTWNSLSATFPTIPYPTRTLLAPAISDPSTIPHPLAHTWSTEHVMQANTALFFVLALGLTPIASDAGIVTFDRAATSETDLKGLISVLKKEKMRWHSDRLGRRNEGVADGGVNTALQRDEKARAVFHGVCGLMEFALA